SAARWIEAAAPGDLGLSVDGSVSSDTLTVIPNAPGAGAVSIVRPALNGEVLEGEPIDIEVRAPADADGEAHRYTEVLLYDASGGLLERRQVASATARLALRAPAVEVPERLRLEARAHYGPAFHYLDAPAVPLTVQPAVAVPRPVVRGVGPTTLRGATLRVWIADTHGHAARIEVLAEDGAVLASGLTEVDHVIAAPVGAELRVRARLEDGLGNQSVEVVSTRVVAAPTFRLEAEEVPFDVAAPVVGGAYLGRGRALLWRDAAGGAVEIARFAQRVAALAVEGDRVFVGTAGDGLHVLDAGRDHRALAHYPWGQVSEVALASGAALVRAGGVLGRYARRGGELELLETHPVDASAGVAPRADGFLVAGAEGLHHIDATGARETLASEPLRTLITHRRAALALTEAGDLLRWTGGGLEVAALGLEAEALVALHGELLAVGQSGLTVVELRSGELTPLGHLPLGARADEGACLTGGQLLLGRSGGVVSLELPAPSFETVHTSERARGTIAALTASRSGFL
ncbi:MAG TPA: hypothetical protein RMH26_05645, partial [Polyangiaceae bacterium LLY-WYZ-15_(1-7)]|nr:hypothetical protein [Polyangiaceae bacterium LLY-WYZ-15_(1-7)]